MGAYQLFLWQKISPCLEFLPDNKKDLARVFITEAFRLSKRQINASCHSVDSAVWAIDSSVVTRHHEWLQSVSLPAETRSKVKDLLFEGYL